MELIELENISDMKNSLYRVNSRLDIGKTISELKCIVEENSHTEEK